VGLRVPQRGAWEAIFAVVVERKRCEIISDGIGLETLGLLFTVLYEYPFHLDNPCLDDVGWVREEKREVGRAIN